MGVSAWEAARVRNTVHLRVYVAHTDLMGVVYNGTYLSWFEIGRTELLRERGLSYAEVEARGLSLPVTEAHFRVRRPARYDDWVRLETRLGRLRTREVGFLYQLYRDDLLLVEGETGHIPVRKSDGRGTRLPDWVLEHLT